MIAAVYLTNYTFSVSGDRTLNFRHNMRVRLIQTAGDAESTVDTSAYDSGSNETTVTLLTGVCVASLSRVEIADTYSDPDNDSGNICEHTHAGRSSGGDLGLTYLTYEVVTKLLSIPLPEDFTANQILGVDSTAAAFEPKTIAGTADQVTVTHSTGVITLAGPQRLAAHNSPTFDELTLTGLTGLMVSQDTSGVTVVAGTAGDVVYYDGADWSALAIATDGQVLTLESGLPSWQTPTASNWHWIGPWALSEDYEISHVVSHNSHLYYCVAGGTSSESDEPGVGVYWEDVWELVI